MYRALYAELLSWCDRDERMPLLLRGARQVGKTFIVEKLGAEEFQYFHNINFELNPEYKQCFKSLEPNTIIDSIAGISGQRIVAGKSLLFLDEIQYCPQAITALRYFKEKMPEIHVIAAGSLLEFALRDEAFSMPVGRIEYLYLKPLSFLEFLQVRGFEVLLEHIQSASIRQPLSEAFHTKLLQIVREYMLVGGMPAAVRTFLKTGLIQDSFRQHTIILTTYRDDFGKYAKTTDHKYLQQVFERAPSLVGQHVGYNKIDPDSRSRDLKRAIADLNDAGVIKSIHPTTAAGLPLAAQINEKRLKLLFLDVGLMNRTLGVTINELMSENITLINKGALAEQFVGQELLAYASYFEDSKLFNWEREKAGSQAEVDYVIAFDSKIIPVEVKAGATGTLRSLHWLMEMRKLPLGIRVSEKPLSLDNNILSVPFYMISELSRLCQEVH